MPQSDGGPHSVDLGEDGQTSVAQRAEVIFLFRDKGSPDEVDRLRPGAALLNGLKHQGKEIQASRAKDEQVAFGHAIQTLGIIRHRLDGRRKIIATNGMDLIRLLLMKKLAKELQVGGYDVGPPVLVDVAKVDGAHGVPNDAVNLQRMSLDLSIMPFAIPHAHDR